MANFFPPDDMPADSILSRWIELPSIARIAVGVAAGLLVLIFVVGTA